MRFQRQVKNVLEATDARPYTAFPTRYRLRALVQNNTMPRTAIAVVLSVFVAARLCLAADCVECPGLAYVQFRFTAIA